MKRILAFLLVAFLAFTLYGCLPNNKIKNEIFSLVEENYDAIVMACQGKDIDSLYAIDGITEVDIVDGYVLFYYKGTGIAPSSQEYGFYYSEDSLPVAVFDGQILCDTTALQEEGNGYQYLDRGGNVFYTEHLMGNIYFYSAAF